MKSKWAIGVLLAAAVAGLGVCSGAIAAQTSGLIPHGPRDVRIDPPRQPEYQPSPDVVMSVSASLTWYGQSFFVVTSRSGARIALDPYHVQDGIKYSPPDVKADAVFLSHEHFDHNNVGLLKGHPKLIAPLSKADWASLAKGTRSGTLQIVLSKFPYRSVFSYHDASGGKERGTNTINVITVDGVKIAHLGDLGAPLSKDQVKEVGRVDILLVPVGGTFTIDAAGATEVVQQLKPRVVIPMHYKTPKISIPLAAVEPFLKGKKNVTRNGDTYSFTKDRWPVGTTILVMKYKE
jgi:L-ascorbate metabolism protein UlaG (beta-lactamase superfamily)